ncbi:hypothetical protein [uncultured Nostoc sp.]
MHPRVPNSKASANAIAIYNDPAELLTQYDSSQESKQSNDQDIII